MLYLGADHRGFELKEKFKEKLKAHNYPFEDLGAYQFEPDDDYTDAALQVAQKAGENKNNQGILICGSGVGVCVAANKVKKIRACLLVNPEIAKAAREDDDINILCLPSDFINENLAWEIIEIFLNTKFVDNERHRRRIKEIEDYENNPSH